MIRYHGVVRGLAMPQFSIKDLIAATTLIGAGLAIAFLTLGPAYEEFRVRFWFVSLALWLGGCALVRRRYVPFQEGSAGGKDRYSNRHSYSAIGSYLSILNPKFKLAHYRPIGRFGVFLSQRLYCVRIASLRSGGALSCGVRRLRQTSHRPVSTTHVQCQCPLHHR